MPTVHYSLPREAKKLNVIHSEGIRIYKGAFKTSLVESLHTEAYGPSMELRRNKLDLRFMCRQRNNSTYTISLNILDDRENQKYVGNECTTKPTRVRLRKLEQGYMKEQKEVEENHQAQQLP